MGQWLIKNFGLHLLLPAAFGWSFVHVPGPESLCRSHQHRTDEPFQSPALSVGLDPKKPHRSFFLAACFTGKSGVKGGLLLSCKDQV